MSGDPTVHAPTRTLTGATDEVQRRTMKSLGVTQVFVGGAVTASVVVGTLLAEDLLGGAAWAGLAGASFTLGSAVGSQFLAGLSNTSGRRPSLGLGALVGSIGAVVAIAGAAWGMAPLFFVGLFFLGWVNSAGLQARYAAADLAHPERRARSVGLIVWALTIGAVAGPHLVGPMKPVARSVHLPPLTGSLIGSAVLALIASALAVTLLRPDPLLHARRLAPPPHEGVVMDPRRTLRAAFANRNATLAVLGLAVSQMTMVAVMSMTPLHLRHGHASDELIGGVISLHILGMYAGSPLWGWVADRAGRVQTVAVGAVVLVAGCGLAAAADPGDHRVLALALFLLGVGWSVGLVASSSLLTESVPLHERVSVQGLTDSLTAACGGAAALASGQIVGSIGYARLALISLALAVSLTLAAPATLLVGRQTAT